MHYFKLYKHNSLKNEPNFIGYTLKIIHFSVQYMM